MRLRLPDLTDGGAESALPWLEAALAEALDVAEAPSGALSVRLPDALSPASSPSRAGQLIVTAGPPFDLGLPAPAAEATSPAPGRRTVRAALRVDGKSVGSLLVHRSGGDAPFDDRSCTRLEASAAAFGSHLELAVGHALRARTLAEEVARVRQERTTLAIAAHDLRAPLSTIRITSQLLLRASPEELAATGGREHVERIQRQAERMSQLAAALLDEEVFAGGRFIVRCRATSVDELLDATAELFAPLAREKGLLLEVRCLPRLTALIDDERLAQALSNLMANALRFTVNGMVRLSAEVTERDLRLTVQDTGPGIAPAELARLLGRAGRPGVLESARSGMGLAIVQGIAEAHGGRLAAESRLGIGSAFHIEVPVEGC